MLIITKNISLVEFVENNHKKEIVYETQIPIDGRNCTPGCGHHSRLHKRGTHCRFVL